MIDPILGYNYSQIISGGDNIDHIKAVLEKFVNGLYIQSEYSN